jgi:hypothetical protein
MNKTYKLFKAIHSFSGTTPYQQLPAQLVWSQSRIPPMLRLVRGLADVTVRSRVRVVASRAYIVAVFVEGLSFGCRWFGAVEIKIDLW